MRNHVLWTSVVVAVLVTPASAATWYAFGTHEPDNGLDSSSFMFFDPPPAGSSRIYFNAVTTVLAAGNPNAGALGTSNEIPTEEFHTAMLGVWKDCNGDGYVGMLESALVEYSAALLTDTSTCPPATGPVNVWQTGAHNYNGWVTELVPIAGVTRDASDDGFDQRIYRDPEAMVWGDYGRPTDTAAAGGTCALWPQPLGTYHSTGGMINFVDCTTGLMEAVNSVFWGRRFAGQDVPGLGVDPFGMTFTNDDDARGHPFWDHETFGSDSSEHSAVTVSDCEADPVVDQAGVTVYQPAPDVHPDGATVPGTVNATVEQNGATDNCDTSDDRGNDFYAFTCQITFPCVGEGEFQGVSDERKTESDWNLQFTDYTRGRNIGPLQQPPFSGFAGADPYFGVQPVRTAGSAVLFNATSMWESSSVLAKTPNTVRISLAEGTVEIDAAYYMTFYAHVGQATRDRAFQLPSASTGTYGDAHCQGKSSGVYDGWECDTTKWYINTDGSRATEPYPFARPGQIYELRDIDCYDGNNDLNVALGLPAYGANPCT